MALPTKEEIAARADYLLRALKAQIDAGGINFKDNRNDDQRRALIAEMLTTLVYEQHGILNQAKIVVEPGSNIRVTTRQPNAAWRSAMMGGGLASGDIGH